MKKYLLITGLIAEPALKKIAQRIPEMDLQVKVLKCTVAALMTTDFIAKQLAADNYLTGMEIIVIPGLCQGSLDAIKTATGCQVLRGPKDLSDLPRFFKTKCFNGDESNYPAVETQVSTLKIVAEIVDAAKMSLEQILARACYYRDNGADIIDLGGDVQGPFPNLREVIKVLKSEGFKVSLDSHQKEDIIAANQAGVDLILSFTSHNLEIAKSLDCPVVVIPDDGQDLNSLYKNMAQLAEWNIPYLADPILPPLTMGLAEGLGRYLQVRREFPKCELFMGLGNVTELIDADSIGINALLVGIASELGINYLLTTEVSHRARGAVREIMLARRLMQKAGLEAKLPKHMDYSLLTIKDPEGNSFSHDELREMQMLTRDKNYRIFVADEIYVFNNAGLWQGASAQKVFSQLNIQNPAHAFYLGRELDKAEIALTLGKKYVQDNPLRWGYLNLEDEGKRGGRNDN